MILKLAEKLRVNDSLLQFKLEIIVKVLIEANVT